MKSILVFLLVAATACGGEAQAFRGRGYAEPKNERQTLDVYTPTAGKDHPVVFWIHGGGWQAGDPTEVQAKPQAFVDQRLRLRLDELPIHAQGHHQGDGR